MLRAVTHSPSLHVEARAVWRDLREAALEPAGEVGVARVIAQRFVLFPQPERSDAEWSAWWQDYYDTLGDLPEEAVEGAMKAYVREPGAEFMPKPGRLRELAQGVVTSAAIRAERCARIAAFDPHRQREYEASLAGRPETKVHKPLTGKDREAVKRMAEDTVRRLSETSGKRVFPAYQWSQAKTDERGLTPEMRDWIASQRGSN